jgi:Ca-activated chloride channel family protein
MHRLGAVVLPLAFTASFAAQLPAQGWIDVDPPTRPNLSSGSVVRTASAVRIVVASREARIEVEERFRNDGAGLAEGSYLYPLSGEAAFTGFSLWSGDTELRGETMDEAKARAIYEEIVRRKRDPALLSLAGHGLLRARVFPIQPGQTRKVALGYSQLLARAGDALRLRYALGSRGGNAETSLTIEIADPSSYGNPYSPTHRIETRSREGRLMVDVSPGAGGDLELFLPLRRPLAGTAVVTHADPGEDGYYMLLLAPPTESGELTVPRDLTLAVDVSGSMSGTKLEQAKSAMLQALGSLRPQDRLRIVTFSSSVRSFRPAPVSATPDNLAAAREFVDGLSAEGGTNIEGALRASLSGDSDPGRLGLVIFLTDGLPSVGEQAPDRLAETAAASVGRLRLFTVGVGPDVNTYLLDRLAVQGRGSAEYVAPGASVEIAMATMLRRMRYPALVNLRIVQTPVELTASSPAALPDLFYGEELVVFGRYRGSGRGRLVVEGTRAGRTERIETPAEFPASDAGNDYIPRLWASRRVGDLTRQIRLEGAGDSLVSEVRQLGLRYGLITEYTAYLVQEPDAVADRPVPLPEELQGGSSRAARQTGAPAFERAKASAKLSQANSLAAAEAVAEDRLESLVKDPPAAQALKRSGGRLFRLRGRVWTDAGYADRMPVTVIAAYSRAYFDLVRMLPEVAPCLAVGDQVLIAGRRAGVRIAVSGIEEWRPGELSAIVRNFRGT